jgi:hypothetical protein
MVCGLSIWSVQPGGNLFSSNAAGLLDVLIDIFRGFPYFLYMGDVTLGPVFMDW